VNTQAQYPDTVISSALWNWEPTLAAALTAIRAGQFNAADYGKWSAMGVKGSELSPLGTFEKKVPADLMKKVRARETEILAGKFTVKIDDNQPKASNK
ncbi:MAG: BMP family ABC transporter substrate-binding protein, partial [Burkholderiaceae bacterium]